MKAMTYDEIVLTLNALKEKKGKKKVTISEVAQALFDALPEENEELTVEGIIKIITQFELLIDGDDEIALAKAICKNFSSPKDKEELESQKVLDFLLSYAVPQSNYPDANPIIYYDMFRNLAIAICRRFSRPKANVDTILSLLPKEKEYKPSRFHMYKQNISQEWCDGWNAYKKQAEENVRKGLNEKK